MQSALNNLLSKSDLIKLLNLSYRSLTCQNYENLKNLVLDLKRLLSFQHALCARVNISDVFQAGPASVQEPSIDIYNISYPAGFLDEYMSNQYYSSDATFCDFVTTLSPVNWLDVDKRYQCEYPALEISLDFNMNDGWTHGTFDPASMDCHVFLLGGPVVENNFRAKTILDYIVPFYSAAYQRLLKKPTQRRAMLTAREIEVLNWIKEGKSSWDISVILKCSQRTIEFHVTNIMKKLDAVNRTQAVVIALEQGLIRF